MAKPDMTADDEQLLALLPRKLAEVAELIGVQGAVKLANAYGGTELYIPANMSAEHPIAQAIGHGQALLLSETYGNDYIDVPLGHAWRRAVRNLAMVSARKRGESQSDVARQYGMTTRGVRMIERKCEADDEDGQIGLF